MNGEKNTVFRKGGRFFDFSIFGTRGLEGGVPAGEGKGGKAV
ncbi:MAG: hypothetical protein Q4C96_06100 [Planctomycetia bacterium]|nr:hypothetical protein [Planctomycetia bacterium]